MNTKAAIAVLARSLRAPAAPRVFTKDFLVQALIDHFGDAPMAPATIARVIAGAEDLGLLTRLRRNLHLNALARPAVAFDEIAGHLQPGCRISLQRALGLYGVANNPSQVITAIVPFDNAGQTNRETRIVSGVEFRFRGIPRRIFEAGADADLEQHWNRPIPGQVPIATAEKALLDWIYLGQSPHSDMRPPPIEDMHIEELDMDRLDRLAAAADLLAPTRAWVDRARAAQTQDWEDVATTMRVTL